MNDIQLLSAIKSGFQHAKDKYKTLSQNQLKIGSALASSIFVDEVSKAIYAMPYYSQHKLNVIHVDDEGKRQSGEWLVDSCVTHEQGAFKEKILFSMESESSTALKAFDEDFAKILHLNSEVRLYLNGLDHLTVRGCDNYIANRLKYIEQRLNAIPLQNLYVGFWPSPQESKGRSLWQQLDQLTHLDKIRLYKYQTGQLMPVGIES